MGWEGTDILTRGEHDRLWRNAFTVIPGIAASLRRSNAIECIKVLHEAGEMADKEFYESILKILESEGFTLTK